MKTFLFKASALFLFFGVMAFTAPSSVNNADLPLFEQAIPERCSIDNTAFQHGEELTYKLYYNWNFVWLSAGEVTFRVKDLGAEYHLSAVGQTYKSYEWFYKVRDRYDSFVDKKSLLPNIAIREIQEGGYSVYDKLTFDQNKKTVKSLRGKNKEAAELKEYTTGDCMHDIISIVYHLRNVDFADMKKGDNIPIKLFMDKEIWPLKVNYRGKEAGKKIKGLGKFNTLVFGPEVIEGYVFKKDSKLNIWVSDDNNKIPLVIESPLSVGSVQAVLKSYKGLKYDMTAKLGK
ncbi:MAG: DUF3108 domain-containing protein [Saprospiraceae bacterium]